MVVTELYTQPFSLEPQFNPLNIPLLRGFVVHSNDVKYLFFAGHWNRFPGNPCEQSRPGLICWSAARLPWFLGYLPVLPSGLEKRKTFHFVQRPDWCIVAKPLHSQAQKVISPNLLSRKCISEVGRIGSIIIFHLSKLWKAKFFILCDVIFLVRLQGKFEIDHS